MTQWILECRAQIDGAVREPGYVFTLPDDVAPPSEVRRDPETGQQIDYPLAKKVEDLPVAEPLAVQSTESPAKPAPDQTG